MNPESKIAAVVGVGTGIRRVAPAPVCGSTRRYAPRRAEHLNQVAAEIQKQGAKLGVPPDAGNSADTP